MVSKVEFCCFVGQVLCLPSAGTHEGYPYAVMQNLT
jgi:hypothetical protein